MRPHLWFLFATIFLAFAFVGEKSALAEAPAIYRWVDSDGVAHFTADITRVPKSLRKQALASQEAAPISPEARTDLPGAAKPAGEGTSEFAERNVDFSGGSNANLFTTNPPTQYRDTSTTDLARIDELEQQVAQDEEAIKNWLIEPGTGGSQTQFEAAARRLPKLQRELTTLRARRSDSE